MKTVTYEEYMNREKIQIENLILNENKIYVTSPSTIHVNFEKVEKIDIDELLTVYSKVIKLAKENGTSISYKNGYKKKLSELEHAYNVAYMKYEEKFNDLLWLWKIQLKEGIRVGYRDDVLYYKAIQPINFEIQKMFYRDSVLSIVREIKRNIKEMYNDMLTGTRYTKICI